MSVADTRLLVKCATDKHIATAVEIVDSDIFKALLAADRIGKCAEMVAFALAAAEHEARKSERESVRAVLDAYRLSLGEIPLGHENHQRGSSTYNWKVSVYEEISSSILSEAEKG